MGNRHLLLGLVIIVILTPKTRMQYVVAMLSTYVDHSLVSIEAWKRPQLIHPLSLLWDFRTDRNRSTCKLYQVL